MVRLCDLHLSAKLRSDAALSLPYTAPYAGRGPRRKNGAKRAYAHGPRQYLQEIIVKTNLRTQAHAHLALCSSDLALVYALTIDNYTWRFHLEFNFRDAQQYWGEDFMNVTTVHSADGVKSSASRPWKLRCSTRRLTGWRRDAL
jgi:putative transposase